MLTPAEKILDFIQTLEKFAHLDCLRPITFLLETSHLARNIAPALCRDVIPLQITQYSTPEMQNCLKS